MQRRRVDRNVHLLRNPLLRRLLGRQHCSNAVARRSIRALREKPHSRLFLVQRSTVVALELVAMIGGRQHHHAPIGVGAVDSERERLDTLPRVAIVRAHGGLEAVDGGW